MTDNFAKPDTNEILNLNSRQIQSHIISVLDKQKNRNIRKNKLTAEVIKELGADIRRKKRDLFEQKIFKALVILEKKGLTRKYKNKKEYPDDCIRVKLLNSQREITRSQRKNGQIKDPINNELQDNLEDIEDLFPIKQHSDLPDKYYSDPDQNSVNLEKESGSSLNNSDKDRRLDIFLGESESGIQDPQIDPIGSQHKDLLKIIKSNYEKDKNNKVDILFNEMKLRIKTKSGYINAIINIYTVKKEIIIRTFIPFLREATEDILKFFSNTDHIGSLCIEGLRNQQYFSIRYSVALSKFTENEIISIIDQIVSESMKVEDIIDGHL